MKIFDLIRMAFKNLKGRWAVLPIIGIAISAFCLCFAGAVLTIVHQEKSLPYELVLSTEDVENLSDSTLAKISKLQDVKAVTPLLQVSANIKTGQYSAQLMLTGISPSYLKDDFVKGGVFPESSVMPYIVMNDSACKQFSNVKKNTDTGTDTGTDDNTATPKIDWLNVGYSLQTGNGGRWIISKVCGILNSEDKEKEPAVYISLFTAKDLLQKNGQSINYTKANVRITNIGCADSVSQAIAALGLSVANTDVELQAKWDTEFKEMTYLIVIGVFGLFCTAILMAAWRKISLLEQKRAWMILRWIGMKQKDITKFFLIQTAMISLVGLIIGIIGSASLPSFLPQEQKGTSIFSIQPPLIIILLSIGICIVFSILPMLLMLKDKSGISADL